MLCCEGYKMFRGRMTVTPGPLATNREPYKLRGTFLFRPDLDVWFCNGDPMFPWGTSVPSDLCSDFVEEM